MKNAENYLQELTTDQLQQVSGGGVIENAIAVATAFGWGPTIEFFLHPFNGYPVPH